MAKKTAPSKPVAATGLGTFQVMIVPKTHVPAMKLLLTDKAPGGPISGSQCKLTGGTLHPTDFNCGDSD